MRDAIEFHIESLRNYGEPVLDPEITAAVVEVGAAIVRLKIGSASPLIESD